MIFKMCNQFKLLRKTENFSKSENVFVTFDSSYTDDSVLLKYDGIFDFRIKLYMFHEILLFCMLLVMKLYFILFFIFHDSSSNTSTKELKSWYVKLQ
jgi:hypothetical protein